MKKFAFLFIFILVFSITFISVNAQIQNYDGIEISNQPLKAGGEIVLKVNSSKLNLNNAEQPVYAVLFSYKAGRVSAVDALMTGKEILIAKFIVPDTADAIVFKFMLGVKEFTNNGNGYCYPVNDKNGETQIGTNYSFYRIKSSDYNAGIFKSNATIAQNYFNIWYQAQDFAKLSYVEKIAAFYVKKDTAALIKQFAQIAEAKNLTEDQFSTLAFYVRSADKATLKLIEKEKVNRFPQGKWYWKQWLDSLRKFPTIQEKLVWIKAFQLVCPQDTIKEYPLVNDMYLDIVRTAVRNYDIQNMILYTSLLETKKNTEERLDYYYTEFVKNAIAKDTLLEESYQLIKISLNRADAKTQSTIGKQLYQSNQMFLVSNQKKYMELASMFGQLLFKLKKYDSSFYYTGLAARYEEFNSPIYNERYFLAMSKIKSVQVTIEALKHVLKGNGVNYNLQQQFLSLYSLTGKNDGAAVLEELLASTKNKIREEVKGKMLNEPAPNFSLKGLNGGNISLSSLRGKVVMLDFWATWCGPCVAAFPAMQQLVDANKTNKSIAVFFVNTWQTELDKYATVYNFLKEKPYKIDVYMDIDNKVVKDFKVVGIPTKVIIDKNGKIRFFSIGFNGDEQKAVDELQAMLDIAEIQD